MTPTAFFDSPPVPDWDLRRYNRDEVIRGLKINRYPLLKTVVSLASHRAVGRLTARVLEFDALVGQVGLVQASCWLIDAFTRGVIVTNGQRIPQGVPLFVTSNHPGQTDAFAVLSQLEGHNIRILAAERPLLRLLPNICEYLIMIPDAPERRMGALRAAANHLNRGGTLLTFPAGKIEADPALRPASVQWSDSTRVFARLVPDLHVLPAAVRGVLSVTALKSPLAQLYREPSQREWVAAILQSLLPRYQDVCVRVTFGEVIHASEGPEAVNARLIAQMTDLLR